MLPFYLIVKEHFSNLSIMQAKRYLRNDTWGGDLLHTFGLDVAIECYLRCLLGSHNS